MTLLPAVHRASFECGPGKISREDLLYEFLISPGEKKKIHWMGAVRGSSGTDFVLSWGNEEFTNWASHSPVTSQELLSHLTHGKLRLG